ncbi:hypothetical protein [Chitinimonas taiwanensis]|uniref:Uncharacterized protein n=1 Tax=Chitinimonas taiwanensis DSM 18899 TaxID=1121279 RepID=A0A1K2HLA1_9NEIS|nr:hypothetical protein [Chitinimonas taiwanensis]SFZ77491.1 hypothetical protein SAMN02745887_02452 [Chitinimonas taiwanensis DSM 18899]
MVTSLGDFHGVDPKLFEESGALDPILGVDTRLFIDPSLLRHTTVPELAESREKVSEHFANVIRLVRNISREDDVFWRRADKLLQFPEVQGLCIGYSSKGVAGKGTGPLKRKRLLSTITQIVRAGNEDAAIFELVGAFEEGVGPDLISDMIAKIIMADLVLFTQRVCSDLGIPMEMTHYSKGLQPDDLPLNPNTKKPIILIPKQILRDLPVAETFADIDWITQHNEAVREELNKIIVGSIRSLTPAERKDRVKHAFIDHPELLKQVIAAYEQEGANFYDFNDDRAGETVWYRASKKLPRQLNLKLSLPIKPTSDDVYAVVEKICLHFKKLIEDNQLCKLLYDKNGQRKHESAAQLLFFGVAAAYCEANDLDLSPESDGGRGPVDFKISSGFSGKVLVEIKLTSNLQLAHGFEKQLPIYQKAESAYKGIYLVIQNDGISDGRWQAFRELVMSSGKRAPTVIVANGVPKPSASIAND